jgi:hypothetical protein
MQVRPILSLDQGLRVEEEQRVVRRLPSPEDLSVLTKKRGPVDESERTWTGHHDHLDRA